MESNRLFHHQYRNSVYERYVIRFVEFLSTQSAQSSDFDVTPSADLLHHFGVLNFMELSWVQFGPAPRVVVDLFVSVDLSRSRFSIALILCWEMGWRARLLK
jgi:hypothetical protein